MIEDTVAAEEAVEEVQEELATQVEAPASLSIQDLANLKNIVDVVSQRGAFRPEEMTVVGNTYNRLVAFLQAISAQQAPEATEETTEEEATAEA